MMTTKICILICFFASFATFAFARKRYDGLHVLLLTPRTNEQLEFLRKLQISTEVEFWEDEIKIGRPVEIMVSSTMADKLITTPELRSSDMRVLNTNIQKSIDAIIARMEDRHKNPDLFNYDSEDYNTLEDIQNHLDYLVTQCPSSFECVVDTIGQSYEGRDIRVFKLSKESSSPRQIVWMDSLIHAREWLAGTTNMRILEKLVTEYGLDRDVTRVLDSYDFYILPVFNPDGYSYSWSDERFWRKSRNINEASTCIGTDLNRNFDFAWGGVGTSSNPCSNNYLGTSPASEPESVAVRNEALRIADRTIVWMNIHTSAMGWLYPYGDLDDNNNCMYPLDADDLEQVVQAACAAITNTHGAIYDCGNSCDVLYATTGSVQDYMYSIGIKYSLTPELRGPGFDPGQSAIEPAFTENWNGLVAMMNEIERVEASKL